MQVRTMHDELGLLATLELALKQLEAAGLGAAPDFDPKSFLQRLQSWINTLQCLDKADERDFILCIENTFLRRRGIIIAVYASAKNVSAILQANGAEHLYHEAFNESTFEWMGDEFPDHEMQEVQQRIEGQTARAMMKRAGLNVAKPKES